MNDQRIRNLRCFEGQKASVALRDGTRLDDCSVVSGGRNGLDNVWLFANGKDLFIPRCEIIDVWPSRNNRPRAA